MEDFVLTAIAREIQVALQGLTVDVLAHIAQAELVIGAARRPYQSAELFVSCDPAQPCLYLLDPYRRGAYPSEETALSARLGKQLIGSEVKGVEKIPYDRIIKITFSDPYSGAYTTLHLYLELIDRAANLFLADAYEVVVDQLQEDSDRRRALSRGARYAPPFRSQKLDPMRIDAAKFHEVLSAGTRAQEPVEKILVNNFAGFSRRLAREVVVRAGGREENLWDSFAGVLREVHGGPHGGRIYSRQPLQDMDYRPLNPVHDLVLSPIALQQCETFHVAGFDSMNAAARAYYTLLSQCKEYRQLSQRLSHAVATQRVKQARLLGHLQAELAEFEQAEELKICGELILANLYKLQEPFRAAARRGDAKITVENYYSQPPSPLEIEVDTKLTLPENAERYFQRYRKAQRGLSVLKEKIPMIERQLEALDAYRAQIESARNIDQLRAAAEALLKPKSPRRTKIEITKGKKLVDEITVRRFTSSDGYEILVGRNNRENDHLTFKVAAAHDLWLHAADYPGSHVVIRNPQKGDVPDRSVREAARLAAYYSQARKNGKVPVHYTQRKFVHKPKGVAPGLVTLSQFKTIVVEPRKEVEG